jgi:hypothetical protein
VSTNKVEQTVTTPLHTVPQIGSTVLLIVVTIAAIGAALLLGVAFTAFLRRHSRPYLLVVAAFTALLGRSIVAGLSIAGLLSTTTHHILEHGMDVLLVALVVAAVYYARTVTHEFSSS